jgi:hypothetical protein
MLVTIEVSESELHEGVTAWLGPWPETLAHVVALGVEPDGLVEVIGLTRPTIAAASTADRLSSVISAWKLRVPKGGV